MIKNKGIWFSALASVMMMTACNSEEDVFSGENNETTGRMMYATGVYGGGSKPQSRMSYEDNLETNHMDLAWSEGDAFSAFISGKGTKYDFKIEDPKNGTYTASETFKCDNFPEDVIDGTIINAFYPSSALPVGSDPKRIALSLAVQQQEGNKSTDHLKNSDYIVGCAEYSSASSDSLNFNFKYTGDGKTGRLANIYRINITLPPAVTSVSTIEISCTDVDNNESLVISENVDITNDTISVSEQKKGKVKLKINNGKVEKGKFVAYVMLFPSKVKERTITVTASEGKTVKLFTNKKTYDSEVDYTRGGFKFININFDPKNFKSEYIQNDFKMWSEDFCNYVPTEEELMKYLGAGVYWDNGSEGDCQQTYIVTDRYGKKGTYHTGLWVKKMKYIDELGSSAESSAFVFTKKGRPVNIDKYFFLPAAGAIDYTDSYKAGIDGVYWSQTRGSSPTMGHLLPYALIFNEVFASVFLSESNIAKLPMVCE